jgi:serine/threonine protein kinase
VNEKPEIRKNAAAGHAASGSVGEAHPEREGSGAQRDRVARPPRPVADSGLLAEGSRFGGYVVGPCVGEGGMARVYRAQHEGLQRQVALKVLLDGQGRDGEGHERFLREARIVAAIKHPNVVNIFDVGVHQGRPYLVMELLEGMDLEAYVASQGPLDEATLMDVIIPIVAGLAAVHDAGIVHRDLKPGNIFLARSRNDEMEPKLLDFGISKSSGPDKMKLTSSKGLLMGTPFYMSPEASQGLEMTPLSDQYALGVVLYEAATGANPFAAANTFGEVVRQVTTGDYPPVTTRNPRLSKRMVAIIERAMSLEPNRRFPDMRAMGRELLALAGQRTRITWGLSFSDLPQTNMLAKAPSVPPPRRDSQRPTHVSRSWYAIPVALLATAAGVVAWQHWPRPEAQSLAPESAAPTPSPTTRVSMDLRGNSANATAPTELAAVPVVERTPDPEDTPPAPHEVVETAAPEHAPSAPEVAAHSAPSVARKSEEPVRRTAQNVGRPSRNAVASAARPKRAVSAAAAAPAAHAATAPSAASDAEPDWVVSRRSSQQAHATDRGTNNAPILD